MRNEYKVAVLIINYNMPEAADKLADFISKNAKHPNDIYLIDNGSDLIHYASNTTVYLEKNVQTCNGWLNTLKVIDKLGNKYFAYWFLITSTSFLSSNIDNLSVLVETLINNPNSVGVHPALSVDSTTNWNHMISRGICGTRETWMIDNIASLYRASWFDSIGRFDSDLSYAWGIDLETGYLARKSKRSLWIDERIVVKKITDLGYMMGRMNMDADERRLLAKKNMDYVMEKKYGLNYMDIFINDFVTDIMR